MILALTFWSILPLQAEPKPRFAFIGLHGGVFDVLKGNEAALGVQLDYLADKDIAQEKVDLSPYSLIFIQHLRSESREAYQHLFRKAKGKNPQLRILPLSGEGQETMLGEGIVTKDEALGRYYSGSRENLRRLLVYALVTYMGRAMTIEPPEEKRTFGFYHPDHEGFFEKVSELLEWARKQGKDVDHLPRIAVAVHQMHLVLQQPLVVDALIRRLEKEELLAVAILDTVPSLKEQYEDLLLEFKPGAVIHTCHSPDKVEFRERLGVPHLTSLFFKKKSIDQWYEGVDGIDPGEFMFQVASQEVLGTTEPQVGAGTKLGGGSEEAYQPLEERIDHLVRRAASWVRLGLKENGDKRVAIIYYDREMGKGELMRGSTTGMFLNAPRSLVRVLHRLREGKYSLSKVPADEEELIGWMMDRGRQIGIWAPGELDRVVRTGGPALVPVKAYEEWLERRVPEAARKELIERWGPPPGKFLVWENDQHERFIVIPKVDLGSVILLPQPLRGEAQDTSLLHDHHVPPPHNYLATYFWLEEAFHADALIHFGTHGSEFALPGKTVGLSDKDWSDIVLSAMPNINPWIIDNLGEALPAKRRAYATLIGYLTPPIVSAGISDELLNLHNDIDKWTTLEPGALRERFRASIKRQVRDAKLDRDLHLEEGDRPLRDDEIAKVAKYLHDIADETTPVSLHVLGEPPREDLQIDNILSCLGKKFLDSLALAIEAPEGPDRESFIRGKGLAAVDLVVRKGLGPQEVLRLVGGKVTGKEWPEGVERGLLLAQKLADGFKRTGQEVDNLLAALDAKFIPPGPGNSPQRNPGAVPTGRNLFVLNPEEVPSRPSWEIGKALVDEMLKKHLAQHGRYPEKIGFDLSSFATFRDYGVMESQILYLLGVEPLWDERNVVSDVRVIPREALGRPRIDVFISALSYYRDNLPSRMVLLDRAVRKVAAMDEEDNGVRMGSLALEARLAKRGVAPKRAKALSEARIFGYPPGQYASMSYYYLVERSGEWNTRDDLMNAYLAQVKNVYTEGLWGEAAPEAYEEAIQGTEVVLRSWSDHMTSPLANKYTWFHGGSLALAVKHLTGKEPEFLLSDVRDPDRSTMVKAEDALAREFRVRLFNRKWIEGMMKEGYAGGDMVAHMVANTLGWEIMREGSVADDVWEQIQAIYVDDRMKLSLREWMEATNPFAFQELTEVLLEAIRKGYWKAGEETVRRLAQEYARSVARHGEGEGLRGGGNKHLDEFVRRALEGLGTPEAAALLAQLRHKPSQAQEASGHAPSAEPIEAVEGNKLELKEEVPPRTPSLSAMFPFLLGGAVMLALLYGFIRRKGGM